MRWTPPGASCGILFRATAAQRREGARTSCLPIGSVIAGLGRSKTVCGASMMLVSIRRGFRQRRIAGPTCDVIDTAPVSRKDVFDAINRDVVTQHTTKEQQLGTAEVRANARGFRYGTVVLSELECSITPAFPFGHVPFLASDPSEGGQPFLERRAGDWHPRAVVLDLAASSPRTDVRGLPQRRRFGARRAFQRQAQHGSRGTARTPWT